jgi:hypothetical protein
MFWTCHEINDNLQGCQVWQVKPWYPLLQPCPIEINFKNVVQFEITTLDKNFHVQPDNIHKASCDSIVKETSLVREITLALGPNNLKDKILFMRTKRIHRL